MTIESVNCNTVVDCEPMMNPADPSTPPTITQRLLLTRRSMPTIKGPASKDKTHLVTDTILPITFACCDCRN